MALAGRTNGLLGSKRAIETIIGYCAAMSLCKEQTINCIAHFSIGAVAVVANKKSLFGPGKTLHSYR
jgi:hypothetical protein